MLGIILDCRPAVLVAVGLPFKREDGVRHFKNGKHATQYRLPNWLKLSSNPEDGLTGEKIPNQILKARQDARDGIIE